MTSAPLHCGVAGLRAARLAGGRFAYYVGRRCRSATIKDVAAELKLDWHTVNALEQQYMEAQLKRAGTPGPRVIGIDEITIPKVQPIGSW